MDRDEKIPLDRKIKELDRRARGDAEPIEILREHICTLEGESERLMEIREAMPTGTGTKATVNKLFNPIIQLFILFNYLSIENEKTHLLYSINLNMWAWK